MLWMLLGCFVAPAASQTGESLPSGKQLSYVVEGSLLQLSLSPDLILSAGNGAEFTILYSEPDDTLLINLTAGQALVFDVRRNRLLELNHGVNSWTLHGELPVRDSDDLLRSVARDAVSRSPYKLSDSIMARQQQYLGSLRIDVRDLNKGLASIIRGLVPK